MQSTYAKVAYGTRGSPNRASGGAPLHSSSSGGSSYTVDRLVTTVFRDLATNENIVSFSLLFFFCGVVFFFDSDFKLIARLSPLIACRLRWRGKTCAVTLISSLWSFSSISIGVATVKSASPSSTTSWARTIWALAWPTLTISFESTMAHRTSNLTLTSFAKWHCPRPTLTCVTWQLPGVSHPTIARLNLCPTTASAYSRASLKRRCSCKERETRARDSWLVAQNSSR